MGETNPKAENKTDTTTTATAKENGKAKPGAPPKMSVKELLALANDLQSMAVVASGKPPWEPVLLRGLKEYFSRGKGEGEGEKEKHQYDPLAPHDYAKEVVAHFFQDMGLGRGIDVTRSQPFAEKTTTQVRLVGYDELLGSDEGGHMHHYIEFAQEGVAFGANIGASIAVSPEMLNLPAAATALLDKATVSVSLSQEASRSKLNSSVVLGMRILNRSVGFKQSMDRLPYHDSLSKIITTLGVELEKRRLDGSTEETRGKPSLEDSIEKLKESLPLGMRATLDEFLKPSQECSAPGGSRMSTFEINLTRWVNRFLKKKDQQEKDEPKKRNVSGSGKIVDETTMAILQCSDDTKADDSATTPVGPGISKIDDKADDETDDETKVQLIDADEEDIKEACNNYTRSTGVTHYVSSIRLGAEVYKSVSHTDYNTLLKSNFSIDVLGIAGTHRDDDDGAIPSQLYWGKSKILTHTVERKLGRLTPGVDDVDDNNKIAKKNFHVRPMDEAVIGYTLKPVASLLMNRKLAQCMAVAAHKYISDKTAALAGPFYIAAHDIVTDKTFYLRKKNDSDEIEATSELSEAHWFKILPASHPEEFHIVYEAHAGENCFSYFLTTHYGIFSAHRKTTPTLEQYPSESNALFAFHNPLHKVLNWNAKLNMEESIMKGETLLINCEGRKLAKDGYLGLQRQPTPVNVPSPNPIQKAELHVGEFKPVCIKYISEDDNILLAFRLLRK